MSSPVQSSKPTNGDPDIIGIYGISGCGKSYLINQLKTQLSGDDYVFFEGAEVIADLVKGGLPAFKNLGEAEQQQYRELAINKIRDICRGSGKTGVVAGHYLFPSPSTNSFNIVGTEKDFEVYTHILYFHPEPQRIANRRKNDTKRQRPLLTTQELERWQSEELRLLRNKCYEKKVLFMTLYDIVTELPHRLKNLIQRLVNYNEQANLTRIIEQLDPILERDPKAVLVFDADKTLAAADSGEMYFEDSHEFSPLVPMFKHVRIRTQGFPSNGIVVQ